MLRLSFPAFCSPHFEAQGKERVNSGLRSTLAVNANRLKNNH